MRMSSPLCCARILSAAFALVNLYQHRNRLAPQRRSVA
jgi:hypothetical protein